MRLALFMPRSTTFYTSVFFAIKRGFEAHGIEVMGWTEQPSGNQLLEFCRQFRPDVLFEMNRTRSEVPELPKEIVHISWIVDLWGREARQLTGSEITYFVEAAWLYANRVTNKQYSDWLAPGFDPTVYYPEGGAREYTNLLFVGHIPLPWSDSERSRVVYQDTQQTLTFGTYVDSCEKKLSELGGIYKIENGSYQSIAEDIFHSLTGKPYCINDQSVKYDIETRVVRMGNRQSMANEALRISPSLAIHGPDNWSAWNTYRHYYRGYEANPHRLRNYYSGARLTIHEGLPLHFRTFDTMASGGALLFRGAQQHDQLGSMTRFFQPYDHYIPLDDIDTVRAYIHDRKRLSKIRDSASKLVRQKHTWTHRCRKILDDLASVAR